MYKIRKSDLLITSIILILFRPTIVSQYFLLDKILSSLNNLILIFGLLIWITKKVPTDKWIRCLAVLCGTMSIFTFINNGNMYYVIEPFKTFTSILVLYLMYRKYGEHFFDIAKNTLFLLVIINLFSMLIFPNGILQIHKEANEWYQYDVVWWIFGNKNATILWLLPLNIMAQLSLLKRKRLNTSIIYDMFIIAVTIVSSILSNSSTTIIVVILLSSFILINKISKNLDKILSSKVILSVYIIFTVLVIFSPQLSIFKSVSQIFGKDTTFTGRTTVWSNAILLITSKPLFGYGLFDADTARNLFGGYAFVNTHNTILQVLVTGGLFLFIQYFYTLYLICNKAGCTNDYSKGSLIKWSILIMCLQFSFEAYIDSTLLWMVLSIIYYASSDNQPNSKTYIWGQFRGRLGNG